MNHIKFDEFARRAAGLLDRRSLLGGLSAALLAAGSVPFAGEAKKKHKRKHKKGSKDGKTCRKRVKSCREKWLPECGKPNDPPDCENVVKTCCKKACDSQQKAESCIFDHVPD